MMKAAVRDSYGPPDVFRVEEVPKPVPGDDELRIKVHAASVSAGDCELRAFKMYFLLWIPLRLFMGVFKPRIRILGQEFAGVVESVGKNVTRWKPGDRVFGPTDISMGAYAEYLCLPGDHSLSGIPQSMSFSEAATIPVGGLNAIHFLRKATIGAVAFSP